MSGHYIKSQLTPDYLTELSFGSGSSSLRLFRMQLFSTSADVFLSISPPRPSLDNLRWMWSQGGEAGRTSRETAARNETGTDWKTKQKDT